MGEKINGSEGGMRCACLVFGRKFREEDTNGLVKPQIGQKYFVSFFSQ